MPDYSHETRLSLQPDHIIAGMDEVGRGPLAGPVAAAIVILNVADLPQGLDDSKRLGTKTRERLFAEICQSAHAVAFATATAAEIDRHNIRQATHLAMRRAAWNLALRPAHILIDGNDIPSGLPGPATALVKGDSLSLSIAAASIVAKVLRDRLMARLGQHYPAYEFHRHAGYPTRYHRAAIKIYGPCPLHRLSFSPFSQQ